jgi:hypothetical protein
MAENTQTKPVNEQPKTQVPRTVEYEKRSIDSTNSAQYKKKN